MKLHTHVMSFAVLLIWMTCPAKSEVVFDSITGATEFGGGIIIGPSSQGGDVVQLAGTARIATRLDVLLNEFAGGGVAGDLRFKVKLWDSVGVPGNLLWTSPEQRTALQNRTPTVVSIQIPQIHVTDKLGWTVEGISNLHSAGVLYAAPTTVGVARGNLIYYQGIGWSYADFPPNNPGGSGFRLIAVPEPTSGGLVTLAIAALSCVKLPRRR